MKCVLIMALAAGCDDGAVEMPELVLVDGEVAAPLDAALDAGADTGIMDADGPDAVLDAGMPDADIGCGAACAELIWREGPTLPAISDHHTTLVHADGDVAALFVIGGIATTPRGSASTVYRTIHRADVRGDGTLGPFAAEPVALPFDLAFHGMARDGDRYYLTGGVTRRDGQIQGNSRVVMLRIGPGPSVAEAVDCGEMEYGVIHPTAEVVGDRLYVIGGSMGPPIDRVQHARLTADDCPTDWRDGPRLPETRSHHASVVLDGRIVLLGGFGERNQVERPAILRSTLDDAGAVDGWEVIGELETVPWTASAFVLDDTLWMIGGGVGGVLARFIDTVQRAPIEDGGIGPFAAVDEPLPFERSHVHQTPVHAGHIYSVGGRIFNEDGMLDSTDRTVIGRLVRP